MTPEEIAAIYRDRNGTSPIALGNMILDCRREYGLSQQDFGRLAGITPGVVHQYESVTRLPEPLRTEFARGRLCFKEARALADLRASKPGRVLDSRTDEITKLFSTGRLSSVWAEKVVAAAKADYSASVDTIVERVLAGVKHKLRNWPGYTPRRPPVPVAHIQADILRLAGEVDAWGMLEHSEVEILPVLAAARLLDDRLHRFVLSPAACKGI